MDISEQGLALIMQFEGFSATPYLCPAGKRTIGYGHVIGAGEQFPPEGISQAQAQTLLKQDVNHSAQAVCRLVLVPLAQCQFDALVSFTFNIGAEAFEKSTLLETLNQGDISAAGGQFARWTYAGDKQIPGLIRRREAESALFLGHKTFTEL